MDSSPDAASPTTSKPDGGLHHSGHGTPERQLVVDDEDTDRHEHLPSAACRTRPELHGG
jgi:hypothetical protein